MSSITAHMVVKNEDQWIWFAIQSVLPYVDSFLITDTGSSDNTVKIIKTINSPKLIFTQKTCLTPYEVTKARQNQILQTKTDWMWVVDGDEIYSDTLCQEIRDLVRLPKQFILTQRYDLLGDVFHHQSSKVGEYSIAGHQGHLSLRVINIKKLKGLNYRHNYPLEGFYDSNNQSILDYPKNLFTLTQHRYWHAGYLKRSSLGSNIKSMFNRNKFKIEVGHKINIRPPQIFYSKKRPSIVPDPLKKRSVIYEVMANLITPIKKLKRRLV